MVPTFTCGLVLSNLSFAMGDGLLSQPLTATRGAPSPATFVFKNGAADGNRTRDLFLTKEVLYRLSHSSSPWNQKWSGRWDSNPRQPAWKAGALPLSYARAVPRFSYF